MTHNLPQTFIQTIEALEVHSKAIHDINKIDELEAARIDLLGKNGQLTCVMKQLGTLDPELRKIAGAELNRVKEVIQTNLATRKADLEAKQLEAQLKAETIDVTLTVRPEHIGKVHILRHVLTEITTYFAKQGFITADGPEVESEEYNFTALNLPEHHPARQSHDTFYLDKPGMLLRTHTSPVQIRSLQKNQPPVRILSPGRVFRRDYDATHTPMFHQVEGLVIETGIHFGHLKGCLLDFCRWFFDRDDVQIRLRPSFFPFTEPSAEVDIACTRKNGELLIGQGSEWLEILGCGMVHPNVLQYCNIDPDKHQGFAFGMGVERLAMLKYNIPDTRSFFDQHPSWLSHYGISPFAGGGQ